MRFLWNYQFPGLSVLSLSLSRARSLSLPTSQVDCALSPSIPHKHTRKWCFFPSLFRMAVIKTIRDRKACLEVLQFSPNGKVGSSFLCDRDFGSTYRFHQTWFAEYILLYNLLYQWLTHSFLLLFCRCSLLAQMRESSIFTSKLKHYMTVKGIMCCIYPL